MTQQVTVQTREIRVFLSSTFRDMGAERSHLVKQVFPKVRAACLERQVGFSEIDLRWGVSKEESKNGATVEICLKEIDRCRDFPPFFVGFLGERYGWVPKHDELAAYWGKRTQTDNDVKPAEHKSESIKSDLEYANTIRQSIDRGISVTELEMELAVLGEGAADKIANHALFCLRDAALTDTLYREQTGKHADHHDPAFFDAGNGKLAALKASIRQSGFLGLDNYTSIEQFGSAVETYLLAQLDRYFPADAVPSAFERGNAAHAAFRFHRLQNFLPRPDVREHMIRAIEQRIDAPSLGPILVTGPSGQGKSALMADLARHMHNQPIANQPVSMNTQARRARHMRILFALAICAIFSEQLYSGLIIDPFILMLAIASGICAWFVYMHGARIRLENRYLDYRALAEACRVQYFWKQAGVKACVADHFLRDQRDELEWIRRAVRTTELMPGELASSREQMRAVANAWLGGQLHYFVGNPGKIAGGSAGINLIRDEVWTRRAGFLFKAGIVTTILLAFFHFLYMEGHGDAKNVVIQMIMLAYGAMFASAGLIKIHQEVNAFSEHSNRYRRMGVAMTVAKQRLESALSNNQLAEAENILLGAGRDALEENGGWLLLHRERPVKVPIG